MRAVTINVTQEDIDAGERYRSDTCPINRAVERAFPGVCCRTLRPYVAVGDSECRAMLPSSARDFMWRFDTERADAVPFSFQIYDPREPDTARLDDWGSVIAPPCEA